MKIKKVGVIGCGLMGRGIAHTAARAGFHTIVREISQELLDNGFSKIFAYIEKGISKGKSTISEREQVRSNLTGTVRLEDLADCDLIIEAITENWELKTKTFMVLDIIASKDTIFASNTSSLKISDLAHAAQRRDKFIGTHFFNPVPVMSLVEIVRTKDTSAETFNTVLEFIRAIDKVPVTCKDTTGFVVNRLLTPYLLDAVRALEAGIASVQDIDNAVTLGLGYPMGPLTLIDFIGAETVLHIAEIMEADFKLPQYSPPGLLRKMVEKGWYGKKSKIGFYDYSSGEAVPNDEKLLRLL